MKKFGAVFMALVICMCSFTACGEPATKEHNWSDWEVTTAATCTTEGVKTRHCLDEGCTETETQKIPKVAHNWGKWTEVTKPTTTTEGKMERTCSVGGEKETQTLPKLTGEGGYTVTTKKAGNCIEEAVYTYTYKDSGLSYEVKGDLDPTNHLGTAYACGNHCSFCSKGTTADDHVAASCGIEGHYICDGADHFACTIAPSANMKFTLINNDSEYRLEKFTAAGTSDAVLIPSYYEGKPVTAIAKEVFYGMSDSYDAQIAEWIDGVTYIYVPDTVKEISPYFAYHMSALEEIRLPKTVTFLPTSSTDARSHAFFDCPALKALNLPRGTETMTQNFGFSSGETQSALKTLTIPKSFKNLADFENYFTAGNVSLEELRYEGTEAEWTALVGKLTEGDFKTLLTELATAEKITYEFNYNTLYTAEGETLRAKASGFNFVEENGGYTLTAYVGGEVETLVIPDEINGIPVKKLDNSVLDATSDKNNQEALKKIKNIQFGTNLEEIGKWNFYGMSELLAVEIPAAVKFIDGQCFVDCAKLATVTVEEGTTLNLAGMTFGNCPALTTVEIPETSYGLLNASAFEGVTASLNIAFNGSEHAWYYLSAGAHADLAKATVTYKYNAENIVQDGNGAEYVLNEDGETYTLVGYYAPVKAGDPLTPVSGQIVPAQFNGKNITAIAAGVFNGDAYPEGEVKTWLTTQLGVLIIGNLDGTTYSDNYVKHIGYNNFVNLLATQIRLPSSIDDTEMVGCFQKVNPLWLRVPRGVKVVKDCFQWSDKYFNGTANVWLILPSSFEKFSGNCWTTTAHPFGVVVDCKNEVALDTWKSYVDASDIATATKGFLKSFSAAVVLGEGNGAGFTYDLFLGMGF